MEPSRRAAEQSCLKAHEVVTICGEIQDGMLIMTLVTMVTAVNYIQKAEGFCLKIFTLTEFVEENILGS